ncbi:hypothetical protein RCC89_07125 [Cytophagaceae bacterium ABcell3]|nr:hypothetical protein RCC89_07125 [Cytophagaceae bacterium ABcell3]
MELIKKVKLRSFYKAYQLTMKRANQMMQKGDINKYMLEIIEADKIMKSIKSLVHTDSNANCGLNPENN